MCDIAAIVTVSEVFLWLITLYLLLRKSVSSRFAAFSYSVVILFALISVIVQVFLVSSLWRYSWIVDVTVLPYIFFTLGKQRGILRSDFLIVRDLILRVPFQTAIFGGVLAYLFLQAVLLPPANGDSLAYHLARVLIYQQENALWPQQNTSCLHQTCHPYGYDVLQFLFLRFYSDFGLGLFGFLSYVAILTSTYATVQRHFANRRLSLLTTLVIGSLTDLVLQATNTKNDLPCATLACVILLATWNWRDRPSSVHVFVVLMGLLYGINVKNYFVLFAVPYVFVTGGWLIRTGKLRDFQPLRGRFSACQLPALSLAAALALMAGMFYVKVSGRYGHPLGPEEFRRHFTNSNGIAGAALNSIRYLAQMTGWPRILGGDWLTRMHDRILGQYRTVGVAQQELTVDLTGSAVTILPAEDAAWYGPLGLLLVLPAVAVGILRPGTIRITSIILLCFFGLMCLTVGWMQFAGRYFAIFFGASGLCLASWLVATLRRLYVFRFLCGVSLLLLFGTATLNLSKPLVDLRRIAAALQTRTGTWLQKWVISTDHARGPFIPAWWLQVQQRDLKYDRMFGNSFLSVFMKVEKHHRVLVVSDGGPIFPFLLRRPDLSFCIRPDLVSPASIEMAAMQDNCHYILCLQRVAVEEFATYRLIGRGEWTDIKKQFALLLQRHAD